MTNYDASPGGGDSGTALRASMTACVADVRVSADLLDRAVARNRRRTARNRLIGAASAVAVVAAVAAVIVSVPGQPAGRTAAAPSAAPVQAQTAAYVLRRAAAAQVNSHHLISVSQDDAGSGTVYTDVATQQQRIVSSLRDSAGQPYFQITNVIKGGVWTDTTIDNQHHVYAIETGSAKDQGFGAVTISGFLPLQTKSDPAAAFQAALKQGIITVAGHQNLDGRDTILIRVRPLTARQRAAAGMPNPPKGARQGPAPFNEIWVNASTYLVVQTKTFKPDRTSFITRVSWLRPTPANLARLTVSPPAGYTRIPYSDMVKYLGPIS